MLNCATIRKELNTRDESVFESELKASIDTVKASMKSLTYFNHDVDVKLLKKRGSDDYAYVVVVKTYYSDSVEEKNFDFKQFISSDCKIFQVLNRYGDFTQGDYNKLITKATVLKLIRPDIEEVEELPTFSEWDAFAVGQSYYIQLMEDLSADDSTIAMKKVEFSDEYDAVYEPDFRGCGKDCLIMPKDKLKEALGLGLNDSKFDALMEAWAVRGYLYIPEASRKTGRRQVKYRLGEYGVLHYAVVADEALAAEIKKIKIT